MCIGNQTEQTDKLVSIIAKQNKAESYGLLSDCTVNTKNGFYHTSVSDIDILDLEKFVLQFDHIIYIKQPIENYDNEEMYYTTRHAIIYIKNRLNIPIETKEISNAKKR